MNEFDFLQSLKQYKKTYAEVIRAPKVIFEQPVFAWIQKGRYNISIDNENYDNNDNSSYFFANNNVKISYTDKQKPNAQNALLLQWVNIADINTTLLNLARLHEIGINENSFCSLFIELSKKSDISLYNDTNVPQEIILEIEKKRCMQILKESLNAEIAVSQLPYLYEIRMRLYNEIEKIDAILAKFQNAEINAQHSEDNAEINADNAENALN
jgi:hypothetical protein